MCFNSSVNCNSPVFLVCVAVKIESWAQGGQARVITACYKKFSFSLLQGNFILLVESLCIVLFSLCKEVDLVVIVSILNLD